MRNNAKLIKYLRAHGIFVGTMRNGHYPITTKNGRRVATLSHTGESNATKACLQDLVRQGLLPTDAKRKSF